MFLFSNMKINEKFKLKEQNGSKRLFLEKGNVMKISTKQDTPVNFFVIEESSSGTFKLNGKNFTIKKAEIHAFETKITGKSEEKVETQNDSQGYESLINAFGNKRSKEILQSYKS